MLLVSGYQEVRLRIKTSSSWLLLAAGGALAPHYHRHRQAPAPGCWAGEKPHASPARASAPPDTAPRWCDRDTGSGNSDIRTSGVLDTNICFFTCLCVYVPKSVIGIGIINEWSNVSAVTLKYKLSTDKCKYKTRAVKTPWLTWSMVGSKWLAVAYWSIINNLSHFTINWDCETHGQRDPRRSQILKQIVVAAVSCVLTTAPQQRTVSMPRYHQYFPPW